MPVSPDPIWRAESGDQLRELVLSGLVDRLPAAIYVAESGVAGRWICASPQISDILGHPAQDYLDDETLWARQLHPADRRRVLALEELLPQTGRSRSEYRMIRPDGQVVWVLDDAMLGAVEPHGLVQHGLLYDITARKRTEMLLAEHADLVERVARGDDLDLTLVELAAATEAVSGVGRCVVEVRADAGLHRGIRVSSAGALADWDLDELGPVTHRTTFTAPDGTALGRICLHYPGRTGSQAQDGELVGWAAGLAAVAVVRAAEHLNVATSMSLLEATLESTADGILVVGVDGQVIGFNQKMVDMWRLDPAAMDAGRDDDLRASVRSQLVDPDAFASRVERLTMWPLESSQDELEFLDGRFFERYSQPQLVDGVAVGRVWSFRDMTLHRQLEQELRAQAFADPLTPLANRGYFMQQLNSALADDGRSAIALLLLDLDDFKTVNDSLGHIIGDGLLIAIAERLQGCLRTGDIAARLGGDEFVVLLDRIGDAEDAMHTAERVLAEVSRPLLVDGQLLTSRASIGIALPASGDTAVDLLRNADLAMYTAKRDGGGRCHRYRPAMHADAMARLELKADLERAIESDELVVYYQPVVDLRTFEIVSVEALVRWQHPVRGLIGPVDFIALAEESRLIDRLGSAVLRQACAQVARWRRTLPERRRLTVSVNLSPRQLSDPELAADVRQALWVAGLPASALVLELTETSLATPGVDAVTVLTELKEIGLALALDDFGVGYSSLGHLVNFPLDILKVDKSFTDRINGDPSGAALLKAVLQVADALSLTATVEGVEDERQLEQVIALGGTNVQGYLLSPPLTAEAATDLLSRPFGQQPRAGLGLA